MVFSSLVFVFAFLPVCTILAAAVAKWTKIQNVVLLAASLLFYSWGEPKYIWLFVGTAAGNWLLVLLAGRIGRKPAARAVGAAAIVLDLAVLFWFKYAGWIGGMLGVSMGAAVLPIGISFYTFQAISYVADVTLMDKYEAERNEYSVFCGQRNRRS